MKKILFSFLFFLPLSLWAQQKISVAGTVASAVDEEALIGVSISVKGSSVGTVTDLDGNFTFSDISGDATLVFAFLGYQSQEVKVNNRNIIRLTLNEDTQALDELVVIGYGVVKKSDVTSSITTVKGDDLKTLSTGNALVSMQGKAVGVQVTGAGSPGASPRVIIRGVTTVNGTDPLYVVDGVAMSSGSNINFLNQDDIESIEILKDASASAIYGTRASNGVILVTTKQGKAGKTTFQFNSSVGFQTLNKPNLADAATYEKVFKERYANDGKTPVWNDNQVLSNTDWWNETIHKTAPMQNYNLSFQGGSDKVIFSGSIGYFRQDSQYDVGYWDRLTGRFNTEYTFNKVVKAGIDFAPRVETWDDTPNLFGSIMKMDPTTPVFRPEADWETNPFNNYARSYHNQEWNPAASIARQNAHSNEYGLIMNPYISLEAIKGLIFRTQFGTNTRFRISDNFEPSFFIDTLEKSEFAEGAKATRNTTGWVDWNWTNTLNYMKTFNEKHNLNLMGGFTMEKFSEYNLEGSQEGIPSNHPNLQYVSAGTINPKASGVNVYNTLNSYLGRAMYNYDNRYYLTASVRVDGSSKFPSKNKYATFPAASVAWRISEEAFMKNQEIFSNLKLRAGWGRVGNQNIDPSAYLNLLTTKDYVFGSNADRTIGTAINQIGNTDLRWETVEDYDLGLDFSVLNGRLGVTADVYNKKSKDMLMERYNLLILGYPMGDGRMWANIGSMQAKGWELSLNWNDKISDFNYGVGINLSSVKNTAIKFAEDTPLLSGMINNSYYVIRNEQGGEISRFYGFVADGIFQTKEEVDNYVGPNGQKLQPDAVPGDIRFKNLTGDDVINDEDKTYIGNAFPDLMLGVNLNLAYKNFDFNANFYGTFGNDIYNQAKGGFYSGANGQNVYADAYDVAWRGEGTSNFYPRLSNSDKNKNYSTPSSFFVEDGSYFRCKLLQLGYTLSKKWTKQTAIRLSVSAQNLFTITNYSGQDPERAAMGSAIESGIDNLGYPNPRTFLFGVNIHF
jgi:TonB-linked SusC/RagA family outer membrane protein